MSESFEQMLEDSLKIIRNGETVEGTVISVKPDEIVLNIGYKSDGIITKREYSNDDSIDLTTVVNEGDTMEALVVKVNDGDGQVLLSYKRLAQIKGNKKLEEAFESGEILKAKVSRVLNGGLSERIEGARRLVKNKNWGILEEHAGDRDTLRLAAGKPNAALPNGCVEPLRQSFHEIVEVGVFEGSEKFHVVSRGVAQQQVLAD